MEIFPNRISNQVWFENSMHTYLLTVAMIYPTVMGFHASTVIQISRRRHVLGTKTWWNSTVWTPRKSYGHLLAPAQIRIGQDGRHWNRSTAWNNDFLPGISPHEFGHLLSILHEITRQITRNAGRFLGIDHQSHCRAPCGSCTQGPLARTHWHLGGGGVGAGSLTPQCWCCVSPHKLAKFNSSSITRKWKQW